ncbi:MAG: tautomerase family protein [Rhodocyclales bacterium]|nr:tautomerase family protein [Rhodocyclales bacterium]
MGRRATDLIVDLLGKRREVTAVLVECKDGAAWHIGGEALARVGDAAPGTTPAHCEIAITAGTNTPAEKARMIAAAHALLTETLGGVPEASYVVIRELPAENWGYAGRTQASRHPGATL